MQNGSEEFKSGFVTFVGRPNAGKSTLINRIIGTKLAITSDTAQTTRHRFRAVKTTESYQLVLVDTPGLHKPHDALGEELNISALKALEDVDAVCFLIDATMPIGRGDEWVAQQLKNVDAPCMLILSKSDLAGDAQLRKQFEAGSVLGDWDAIAACSAKTGDGVDALVDSIVNMLPAGPLWFPEDMDTDQPIEVLVAEFVREKILRSFSDEIPHAIGVQTEELRYEHKRGMHVVRAIVYVERDSQKGMMIGKGGAAIKRIGTEARADLERLLGTPVYLDLSVKVKKNWRRDAAQIRRFGYGEGA